MNNQVILIAILASLALTIGLSQITEAAKNPKEAIIAKHLSYFEIENMGFYSDQGQIKLNINGEYAVYKNNGTAFIFNQFKPIEYDRMDRILEESDSQDLNDNKTLEIPLETAKNIANPFKNEIKELKDEIEELKEENDNNNNDDKDSNSNDGNDNNSDNNNADNSSDTVEERDPRDAEKYDMIDWRDGENPENDMTLEEVENHYEEKQNNEEEENQEEPKEEESNPYNNNEEDETD